MFRLILLMSLCLVSLRAEEEIVVMLSTENQLIPITVGFADEKSGFDAGYVKKLEDVLRFDLNYNGMTTVSNQGVYSVKVRVNEHKLYARVSNGKQEKSIEGLVLSGYLNEDRRVIHRLANAIHFELFGTQGIAESRFLFTKKMGKNSEVWEADYDGQNARQLTQEGGYCVTPCYIPPKSGKMPGSYLYVSYKNGQPKIFAAPLKGGNGQRVSYLGGNQLMPTMSRQRDVLAFISDVMGNPDLFILPFNPESGATDKPRQIYSAGLAAQGTPSFNPDGSKVAFVSNKDGSPRVYVMDVPALGTRLKDIKTQLISKSNQESTAPAWSPDGTKMAYCSMTKGTRQIWMYDFVKKEERQLTQGPGNKENPSWASNSLHIVFNSTAVGDSEIYLLNLKQPNTLKLTSGPGDKRFPNFMP